MGVPEGERPESSSTRDWWLRVPATLFAPRSVFAALRNDEDEDVGARQEPLLLVVWMAGAAAVLATPTAATLMDNPEYDGALTAVWTFVAGGIYGLAGYLLLGFALLFGARLLGSLGDFRRARHIVGFAAVPLALSFLVVLPLRVVAFGGDTFRSGGSDEGAGETIALAAQLAFVAWSLALLLLGVRVVHGWSLPRSLAAVGACVGLLVAILALFLLI